MKYTFWFILTCTVVGLGACAPIAAPTSPNGPARVQTLRIELPTDADLGDLSRLMAADVLRKEGYTVEAVDFNDNALSMQALEQGNLDLAYIGNGIAWNAIQKGAGVVTILDDLNDKRVLAVQPNIKKCADLDGKQVAVPSTTSSQGVSVQKYIRDVCPEAKIDLAVISSPNSRYIALTTGQVAGATMNETDFHAYEMLDNSDLATLPDFTAKFKDLRGAGQVTRRELVDNYPETVKDIVRALLTTRRQIQDLDVLTENAVKYLKMDPEEARQVGKIYLDAKVWDPNGGWTPENLQQNLDFFVETGAVQPGMSIKDIANLDILNSVLDEIGRQ